MLNYQFGFLQAIPHWVIFGTCIFFHRVNPKFKIFSMELIAHTQIVNPQATNRISVSFIGSTSEAIAKVKRQEGEPGI